MSRNCAFYIRVSSDIQDYQRQISDLTQFAQENGFSIDKHHIYEDKISGFKNEKERDGLNRMIKEITEHQIKFILIWELSRLARKHKDLLELTDLFESKGIDIYFYIQRFWLLDENGKKSPQAGLSIAVFGWQAEYEARLTKERFLSAKKLNESLGKYNGGKITFGYTLDENNKYVINHNPIDGLNVSESEIVKEIFDLYEEGLTCSKICRIARSKGYPKIVCNTHTLARVLRDTSYIGFKEVKLGRRSVPSIISKRQFESVANLIESNKTKADKGKKHIYLLRGILKCRYCGEYYVGKQTDDAYICPKNSGSNKTNKNSCCKGGNISTSNIDGIVWTRTKAMMMIMKADGFDNIIEGSDQSITELQHQITNYEKLISKTEQRRRRTNLMFQSDGYTIEEYQKIIKEVIKEREECEREITEIESKIHYQNKIKEESNKLSNRRININLINDRKQIKTIIRGLIKDIQFYKVDTFKTIVSIHYYTGHKEIIIYNSVAKKGNFYRLLNPFYIRFDEKTNLFYLLKSKQETIFKARTQILKEKGIALDLPDFVTLQDFARQLRIYGLIDINVLDVLEPYPDSNNSEIHNFDSIMKHEDIQDIITTDTYNKLTYFKELNINRFNRRK